MNSKNKNKDKISFEKRRFKTSSLSNLLPGMIQSMGKQSQKSHQGISIIKIISHWDEIMGTELAPHSQPLKVQYHKQKNKDNGELETIITIKILSENAFGTVIAMRQNIILQRLNRMFGTDKFKKISIDLGKVAAKTKTRQINDHKHYDLNLPDIDDVVLKSRLESLGQAVMNSTRK